MSPPATANAPVYAPRGGASSGDDGQGAAVAEIGGARGFGVGGRDATDGVGERQLAAHDEGDELGQKIGMAADDTEDVRLGGDEARPIGRGGLGAVPVEERDGGAGRDGGERARPIARPGGEDDGAVDGAVDELGAFG